MAENRYFNRNNGDVAEFSQTNSRLDRLPNWVRVRDDEHLAELRRDNIDSGRGNLLGSSNVGDRVEARHQVPTSTRQSRIEYTEPSKTELPGQGPEAEDYHTERQPEVVTVDPSKQVEPIAGEGARDLGDDEQHAGQFKTEDAVPVEDPATAPAEPNPDNRPARTAVKSEWVDWAVECGADRDEAEDMTKADLIDIYGGN